MGFFDDLGRTISGASQNMVQKSRDHSDANRFMALISSEEQNIMAAYAEIGRLYIEKYEGNYNKDIEGIVNSVKESQSRIDEYRLRVQELRNMQTCSQCGMEISRDMAFCPSCGNKMPVVMNPYMQMNPIGMQDMPMGAPMGAPNMPMGAPMGAPNMPMGAPMGTPNMPMGAPMGAPNMPMGAPAAPVAPAPVPNPAPVSDPAPMPVPVTAPGGEKKEEKAPENSADTSVEKAPETNLVPKFCSKCGTPIQEGLKFCMNCGTPV